MTTVQSKRGYFGGGPYSEIRSIDWLYNANS
jgi:hypothetical protein